MAGLNFVQTGDNSQLIASLNQSKRAFNQLDAAAKESGSSIDDVATKLGSVASLVGVSFGAAGVVSFAKKIYEVRSSMQDLESTMRVFLGSEEKAIEFTKELQDYAYWNMFEFSDLTEASTQLMAYGTQVEDLIPIIDKLSNVATGAKKPLDEYIRLFNKAKATGKVDQRGMETWASAGIVLTDTLKEMGEQVTGSTVSFEQLQKVLEYVTSDGQRFGGLMMSQMDNLSASYGQLQDNITNMLNEIGEKTQDAFKKGIDIAGVLVDNYETVGKALATLITMYGEYRAAIILTNAALAAGKFVENIRLIAMFRKELGLLTAAQQAFNITAMENPYVLIATGAIMAVTAIVGLVKVLEDNRSAMEIANDTYDERIRLLEDESRLANEQIRTLKDETASTEALVKARLALLELPAFQEKGVSSAQLAKMTLDEIKSVLDEYDSEQRIQAEDERKQVNRNTRSRSSDVYARNIYANVGVAYGAADITQKAAADALDEIKKIDKAELDEFILKLSQSGKSLEQQSKELQSNASRWEEYKAKAEAANDELKNKKKLTDDDRVAMGRNNLVIERATALLVLFNDALRVNQHEIEESNKKSNGPTLSDITKSIRDAEKDVRKAREDFSKGLIDKKAVETAEASLKGYQDDYAAATGKTWVSTKKKIEDIVKAERDAADERIKIESERIKNERMKRQAELNQQLKELDRQSKEWSKNNNGAINGAFELRKNNLIAQFKLDTADADRQFREWKRTFEQSNDKLRLEIEIGDDNRIAKFSTNAKERTEALLNVRKKELELLDEENRLEKENALIQKAGSRDAYDQYVKYKKAVESGNDDIAEWYDHLAQSLPDNLTDEEFLDYVNALKQTYAEMTEQEKAYDENAKLQRQNKEQEYADADLDYLYSIVDNYGDYNRRMTALETQRQEAINKAEALLKKKLISDDEFKTFLETISKQYKQGVADLLRDSWNVDVVATDIRGGAKKIAISIANEGMESAKKISVSKARKLVQELKKAMSLKSSGKEADNTGTIANILGIDEKAATEMTNNTDVMVKQIDNLESAIGSFSESAGGDWSGLLETFANTFKEVYESIDDDEGQKGAKAFKETFTQMFTGDNLAKSIGGIVQGMSQLYESIAQIVQISGNGSFGDGMEAIGGIFQNFAAAGQGAATGGWIGAIVGGVTDALGQIFGAITKNIEALNEARIAAEQYATSLRELHYTSMLDLNEGILGGNITRRQLLNAVETLKEAQSNLNASIQDYGNAALQQLDKLGGLASFDEMSDVKLGQLIALAVTGGISAIFTPGALDDMRKFNDQLKQSYELTTLIGGAESFTAKNVHQFVDAVKNGYTALEAMQIKTLDKAGSRHDEWMSLKDLAPDIFNEDGTINTEHLEAFLNAYGDKLTEAQKLLLENLRVDAEAYNDSLEQALSYYGDMFGDIGKSIENAFVDAFQKGEDALDSFTKSVEDMFEEWIKSLAYMAYIAPYIEKAQTDIENAVKEGKSADEIDKIAQDSIAYLMDNFETMEDGYTNFLEQQKAIVDQRFGTNVFGNEDEEATRGGFQAMSQDTADELNARFTALQIEGANVVASTTSMLSAILAMQLDVNRHTGILQNIEAYQLTAYQQAEERIGVIRAIRDNTDQILANTNRLKAIEQNTARI